MALSVLIAAEVWNRKDGAVVKSVVRTEGGRFVGVTNQTREVKA